MGIFDVFTGKPAREAAAANRKLYGDFNTGGNAIYDTAMPRAVSALEGGSMQARADIGAGYDAAGAAFGPLADLGRKYGAGSDLYLDALGVNGAAGLARAQGAYAASPGYQWQLDQGLEAINRSRNAAGMMASGNTDIDALKYGQGAAQQDYGTWLGRLAGLIPPELSATQGVATGLSGVATGRANTLAGLDTGTAGALADLYASDADKRAALLREMTAGITGANTAEAQAKIAGSGKIWDTALDLGRLGVSAYAAYNKVPKV